jgi:hypothetical protein
MTLQDEAVPMAVLHGRYGSSHKLVRRIIGVVRNYDPYPESWQPAKARIA